MFVKLLKYEWRTNRSLIGLMCAVIGISGLLSGGILRYITWSAVTGNSFMVNLYSIVLAAAILTCVFCCVSVMYLLAFRFCKSRFGDHGYLMLTLPVSIHQHLVTGIVHTLIGVMLVGITAFVSATVGISIYLTSFDQATSAELWGIFTEAARQLNSPDSLAPWSGIKVFALFASFLADIILFMLSLTLGFQSHKHPILKGATVYIGVDILVSEACALLGYLTKNALLTDLVSCAVYGAVAVITYCIMHRMIDKKLNLT